VRVLRTTCLVCVQGQHISLVKSTPALSMFTYTIENGLKRNKEPKATLIDEQRHCSGGNLRTPEGHGSVESLDPSRLGVNECSS